VSTSPTGYRKLRARGWTWGGRARLWLGADHLLEVHSTTFTEHYRRYFLRDIRAVVVERTRAAIWWSIFGAAMLLLCGGAAAALYFFGASRDSEPEQIAWWIFGGFFAAGAFLGLLVLLFQLVFGPSCACHIVTTAGRRALAAPSRLRPAERLLTELTPLVAAAQESTL
jgi:hypothetical protein